MSLQLTQRRGEKGDAEVISTVESNTNNNPSTTSNDINDLSLTDPLLSQNPQKNIESSSTTTTSNITTTTTTTAATNHLKKEGGTVQETIANIGKTCMGSGTLALPFAASRGGLMFNVIGLIFVAKWNVWSVARLMKCLDFIPKENNMSDMSGLSSWRRPPPPKGTSTYGRVTWYAFGPMGLQALNAIMLTLFLGIITAYQAALVGFIKLTPFTTGSPTMDLMATVTFIAPLSCGKDLQYLSKFSALGIFAVLFTFVVIFWHGLMENGLNGLTNNNQSTLDMWPKDFTSISNWFGVTMFGFGIVPISYNVRESMKDPNQMERATNVALLAVLIIYVCISNGTVILYSPSIPKFEGDVLEYLPQSWIPTMIRIIMAFVVVVSAPLIVLPCGEMIEGKLYPGIEITFATRATIRTIVCIVCSLLGSIVPGFVHVVSFIGCFCVGMTSFVLPPLLHLMLAQKQQRWLKRQQSNHQDDVDVDLIMDGEDNMNENEEHDIERGISIHRVVRFLGMDSVKNRPVVMADMAFLVWGVMTTAVTSFLTFQHMMEQIG